MVSPSKTTRNSNKAKLMSTSLKALTTKFNKGLKRIVYQPGVKCAYFVASKLLRAAF